MKSLGKTHVEMISTSVKIYPLFGLTGKPKVKAGRAWVIFTLAKHLADGLDHILLDELKSVALQFGVSDRNFRRWIYSANSFEMMKLVRRKGGQKVLVLKSYRKVARQFGVTRQFDAYYISVDQLLGRDWQAYVFAGWQAKSTQNGKILTSQKRQAEKTGISEQTQRKYNKKAGVTSTKNFAKSNIHANGYASVIERRPRAFLNTFWDYKTHQWMASFRLPDSRVWSKFGLSGPEKSPGTMSLFNYTDKQYFASMMAYHAARGENQPTLDELYLFDQLSQKGTQFWIHTPLI